MKCIELYIIKLIRNVFTGNDTENVNIYVVINLNLVYNTIASIENIHIWMLCFFINHKCMQWCTE